MLHILSIAEDRPLRLDTNKDENYHARFGRYCVGQGYNHQHAEWIKNTDVNKNFYKNNQWQFEEDTTLFFKDESGNARNRIKMTQNIIRPMIEQYRGNAIRMTINARCQSVSPMAINRREEKLAEALFFTDVAKQGGIAESLTKTKSIGKSKAETEQIFTNLYIDSFLPTMNALLKYVASLNEFESMQLKIAEDMGLSGLGVIEDYEYGGHHRFEAVPSNEFFFDRSCKRHDGQDGEFMGRYKMMLPSEIFEWFQIEDSSTRSAIETYSKEFQSIMSSEAKIITSGRIPVVFSTWKDSDNHKYGYVKDEFGYPYLTRINYTRPGEEAPRYTDKDVISVNTQRSKRVLKGKDTANLYLETIRYCVFIPSEVVGGNKKEGKAKDSPDIVLEHGLLPYQETDISDISDAKFPYKMFCWSIIDGDITAPVDDAISPQRFINRMLSIVDNQANNSRGSGTVYDQSALGEGGEAELLANMNQSKPIGLDARGRGIQNILGSYDSTIKQGTMTMFNIIEAISSMSEKTTGINEALKGESTGSDQLVGVTQLLMQKGSLMQEPFYNAISYIFLQCFQAIASRGKRIYADNERELAIAVGDDGVNIIKITKEMKLEEFRAFVKRDNSDEMLINSANQMITILLQLGLIDDIRYSNLYNRATPDDVARELRAAAKERIEIKRMQNEKNKVQEAQQIQMIQQTEAKEDERIQRGVRDSAMFMDKAHGQKLEEIEAKTFGKVIENNSLPKNNLEKTE